VTQIAQTSLLFNMYARNPNKIIIDDNGKIFVSIEFIGIYRFSLNSTGLTEDYNVRFSNKNRDLFISDNKLFHTIDKPGLGVFDITENKIRYMDSFTLSSAAYKIDKGPYGFIFVAMKSGGFHVLRYRNDTFEFIAKAGYGDIVMDVSVTPNYKYIATACWRNGLKVYSFDGNKLKLIKHVVYQSLEQRPGYYVDDEWTESNSVEFADNEKLYYGYFYQGIFLGKSAPSIRTPTIRKYKVIDNTVTGLETRYYYDRITHVNGITADYRGNIFVALGSAGYWELKYNQPGYFSSYSGSAEEFSISDDHNVYLANGTGGLNAYYYLQNFQFINNIDNGGRALGVESVGKNMVFLANDSDGLRAYTHDDSEFCNQAHMYNGLNCYDVTVLQDSTIIISEGYNGIRALSYNGWIEMVNNHTIPVSYNLYQNYPNPFNPKTTISYQLPAVSDVQLIIFDISGRKIKQWSYQNQQAGSYNITWNGTNRNGNPVPSGVYIYHMVAGEFVESKKMVLLK
jgi:hypothetical protein